MTGKPHISGHIQNASQPTYSWVVYFSGVQSPNMAWFHSWREAIDYVLSGRVGQLRYF